MSIATSVHRRTTLRTAAAMGLLPFLDLLPTFEDCARRIYMSG